jgi:hypothetical protein
LAFDEAVLAFVANHERQMRGCVRRRGVRFAKGAKEDGECIGPHCFKEKRAIVDPVEFGRVHAIPE